MKKLSVIISGLMIAVATTAMAAQFTHDITHKIPVISWDAVPGFQKIPDVAHPGIADWDNAIGIARGITLDEARRIADDYPEITHFFYMKGWQMVLGTGVDDGSCRVFSYGDTVFFTGEALWGAANGLSDGYERN